MKKITAFLILLCCCSTAFSQRAYFIYLQSEGGQPFFLKMKEQVLSSNSSGYLILSKLRDSTYTFSIGFPQNKWPEQAFEIPVNGRDKGFLLKKEGETGWDLADLQTGDKINGQATVKQRSVRTEPKEVSVFTDVLSKAANDPSLKERVVPVSVPQKEEKAPEAAAVVRTEIPPPVIDKADTDSRTLEEMVAKDSAAIADSLIAAAAPDKKTAEATKKEDTISSAAPIEDTVAQTLAQVPEKIRVVIPEKKPEVTAAKEETAVSAPAVVDTIRMQAQDSVRKEEQPVNDQTVAYKPSVVRRRTESSTTEGFGVTYVDEYPDGKKDTIQIFIPNPKTINRNVPPPQEETKFLPMDSEAKDLTPAKKEQTAKNDCSSMASETDYLRLRKKMVSTDGDDAMLAAAKKVFKGKCFTTEQVKNLGTLFLNDAGRYNFFDAAYLAVSDRENFPGLQAELKDEYYISRFKAMLR